MTHTTFCRMLYVSCIIKSMVFKRTCVRDTAEVLRLGGVAVIPTDTIYGIVGSALEFGHRVAYRAAKAEKHPKTDDR
jgi:tRNA A37 threonylcarbamoyladenosine synthetase subunit TsaC/SUA5/YrdC